MLDCDMLDCDVLDWQEASGIAILTPGHTMAITKQAASDPKHRLCEVHELRSVLHVRQKPAQNTAIA